MALLLVLAVACRGGSDGAGEAISIVVTTNILGDVVEQVVGEDAEVEVLLPAGVDPHEYQASSQQVAALAKADLVVANGLGLEEGLVDALEAAESDGVNVFEVAPLLSPIGFGDETCEPEAGHGHGQDEVGGCDPHVWMDPLRMADAARLVAAELEAISGGGLWQSRAGGYAAELTAADGEIGQLMAVVPAGRRRLVTNHDTLGYFAARYGFEVIGTVVPGGSTLGAPSSEELAALVEVIRQEGVSVIFAETIEPATLAEAVASELDAHVEVVELHTDSLGESGTDADTLIGMLVANARLIADALG
jgi:zinc/manganese transport system substrate-binding protein